eukprot:g8325.t1
MPTASSPSTIGNDGRSAGSSEFSRLDEFPELNITNRDDELLNSLLKETGWGEKSKTEQDDDKVTLPIEWVVDIADKDGDWFIGTATGYNDAKQTLHVMVPDREAPTWKGDVSVNPLTVRLLECCDSRSVALFKQLVRESAIEVDWGVRIERNSGRTTRPAAEVDPDNNDTGSGNSEHTGDADGESSAREAARYGTGTSSAATVGAAADTAAILEDGAENATLPGEVLPPTAASTAATAIAAGAGAAPNEKVPENAMGMAVTDARATLLLPLGNFVVVEIEGCSGHGVAGTASCAFTGESGSGGDREESEVPAAASGEAARRLVRLDERVEIVHCRGAGDPGEEAFYRVAEEGLVWYDPVKINWRAYKRRAKIRRQDERRRGSLDPSSSSAIEALTAPAGHGGGDAGRGAGASLLEGIGKEVRSLARRALELRDDLLTEHLATLRRVRRLVLDGSLEDGAALMEQVDEANVGVLDERSARDKDRITADADALESLIFAVAGQLKQTKHAAAPPPLPSPPEGGGTSTGDKNLNPTPESPIITGGTVAEAESILPSPLDVAGSPIAGAGSGS